MNHDHLRMLLPRYAAGTLAQEQAATVQTHLATGCTTCLTDLYRLPVGIPRAPVATEIPVTTGTPAAPIGEGPLARAARSSSQLAQSPAPFAANPRLVACAGGVLLVGLLCAWGARIMADRTRLATALQQLEADRTVVVEMIEEISTGPGGVQTLALEPGVRGTASHGLALWNPTRNAVLVLVGGLPRAGYRAEVSLVGGLAVTAPFTVTSRGEAIVPVRLPAHPPRLGTVKITDSTGGTMHLRGALDDEAATTGLLRGNGAVTAGTKPRRE